MLDVSKVIYSILNGNAGISAIVGTRIMPFARISTATTLPAITYYGTGREREANQSSCGGFSIQRVQIDCWASSYATVVGLADKVIKALDGYTGTASSVVVGLIRFENSIDMYEQPQADNQVGIYRVMTEWSFYYTESA